MCQDAMIIQGEDRRFASGCGELCRVIGIDLVDLPAMGGVAAEGGFMDDECLCHVDFDRLGATWGFTVRREPMEVILTGPPASDAKYRKWVQAIAPLAPDEPA